MPWEVPVVALAHLAAHRPHVLAAVDGTKAATSWYRYDPVPRPAKTCGNPQVAKRCAMVSTMETQSRSEGPPRSTPSVRLASVVPEVLAVQAPAPPVRQIHDITVDVAGLLARPGLLDRRGRPCIVRIAQGIPSTRALQDLNL